MDFGFGDTMPFASRLKKQGPRKPDPVARDLACSLEELYNGCTKALKVTRKVGFSLDLVRSEWRHQKVRGHTERRQTYPATDRKGEGESYPTTEHAVGSGCRGKRTQRLKSVSFFFFVVHAYVVPEETSPVRIGRKGANRIFPGYLWREKGGRARGRRERKDAWRYLLRACHSGGCRRLDGYVASDTRTSAGVRAGGPSAPRIRHPGAGRMPSSTTREEKSAI